MAATELDAEANVPNWNLYVLLTDGRPYYVGATRRTPEIRLRELARAGRRIDGSDNYEILTSAGGPTYLALTQTGARWTAEKLGIYPGPDE